MGVITDRVIRAARLYRQIDTTQKALDRVKARLDAETQHMSTCEKDLFLIQTGRKLEGSRVAPNKRRNISGTKQESKQSNRGPKAVKKGRKVREAVNP
jgi:hypothetical protein